MKRVSLFTLMCMTIILTGCSNDGKDAENSGNILQRFTQLFSKTTTSVSSTVTLREGTYYIKAAANSTYVLTAFGPAANGNITMLWRNEGNANQKWILKNNSDGTITLRTAMNTKYVLDLNNSTLANGTKIQLFEWNNTNAQKWRLAKAGDYYRIVSAYSSDWAVDMHTISQGQKLWLWQVNDISGGYAQKWIFSYINSNTSTIGSGQSTQQTTTTTSPGQTLVPVQVWVPCSGCGGSGKCPVCYGSGRYGSATSSVTVQCECCKGNGICPYCHGAGGSYRTEYQYR